MTIEELGSLPVRVEVEFETYPSFAYPKEATHLQTFVRIRTATGTFTFSDRLALVDIEARRDVEIEAGRAVTEALGAWARYDAIQKEAKR